MVTKLIPCPRCRKITAYDSKNSFRPFCSERCKLIDTAAWADEQHKIPGESHYDESEKALWPIEEKE